MTTGLLLPPPPPTGPTIDGLVDPDNATEERRYGVVDGRTLIGVQTIDIGRLQSHFIPVIPVGFVAVAGQGPTDSNQSGKTTFEAVVAYANGDPEWNHRGQGPAEAAGLLFSPVKDGSGDDGDVAYAQTGYVVCVYARLDSDDPDPITVWTQINATTPHTRIRYTRGVFIAEGDTAAERLASAEATWRALPAASEFGPTKIIDRLFGGHVTCMAYVANRGNLPSKPSLLSGIRSLTPKQIGESLVTLAGLRALFDKEEQGRREYDEERHALADARDINAKATDREDTTVGQIDARDTARSLVTEAASQMRLHYARGYLDALDRDADLAAEAADLGETIDELGREKAQVVADRANVADRSTLDSQLEEAQGRYEAADDAHRDADRKVEQLAGDVGRLQTDVNTLRPLADAHTGGDVTAAENLLGTARDREDDARADLRTAVKLLAEARKHRDDVRRGSNATVDRLRAPDIDAVVLVDVVAVDESARARWEPLLHPWRDTIVVADTDAARAVEKLAGHPGTVIAAGADDDTAGMPDGIVTADPRARRLLTWLDQTGKATGTETATYTAAGVTVVGGFPLPISGRHAREQAAADNVAAAEQLLASEQERHEQACDDTAAAVEHLDRAAAAAKLPILERELAGTTGELADARTTVKARLADRTARHRELVKVEAAVTNHDALLASYDNSLARLTDRIAHAKDRKGKIVDERARLNIDYWAGQWGGTRDQAEAALAGDNRKSTSFKNRANEKLTEALWNLGVNPTSGEGPVPARVTAAIAARGSHTDSTDSDGDREDSRRAVRAVDGLVEWLDAIRPRDHEQRTRIERDRHERRSRVESLHRSCVELHRTLETTQGLLDREVRTAIGRTANKFDDLNRANGLAGGTLKIAGDYRPHVPHPDDVDAALTLHSWEWHIEPAWPLKHNGPPTSYLHSAVNKGQEKIVSTNLLLAAFLAGTERPGRLLLIDELSNDLGDTSRTWILRTLANAAHTARFTVLATCQDDLLPKAATFAQQVLLFHYATTEHTLNQPTRVYGYDPDDTRVQLIRDLVVQGRPFT